MRPHRYTHRDRNQSVIVDALRKCGFEVYDISTVSDSQCPGDILVYAYQFERDAYIWQPFEIKRKGAPVSPSQQLAHDSGKIPIANGAEDVLRWYGAID